MRGKIKIVTSQWVFALMLANSLPLLGQATGTITGTVADTSNAVISDALVTVTQVGTNFKRVTQTNTTGQYVVPLLPVGNYQVRIEKSGFTPFVQSGIILQADSQLQANAVLKVGGTATQITVGAESTQLQTNSTTLVQVVDSSRVVNLPLNGRDVLDLVGLNAGVATTGVNVTYQGTDLGFGPTYQPSVSVAGTRGTSLNYLLDSGDFNDTETNLPYPFPSPDSVQEFSVQMSTFDAQYGRAAGGVVNAVTKSGTNSFHGSVFEFLRNYDLNAANYFSGLDSLKRNQFGATFGGPLWKNHTFFFGSYQGTRTSTATPGVLETVPSAAMKSGDFSAWLKPDGTGQIYDPQTGLPFSGNIIPENRIDPVSAKVLAAIPSSDTYQTRYATPQTRTRDDQFLVRVDHSLTEYKRLWARYYYFHLNDPAVGDPHNLLYTSAGQVGTFADLTGGYSYVISPRWLNLLNASYASEDPVVRGTPSNPLINMQLLGANVKNAPNLTLLTVNITGWSSINMGNVATNHVRSIQVTDTASYVSGKHDLHFGMDIRNYRNGFTTYFQTGGISSFTGQETTHPGKIDAGDAYAELVLGVASTWTQDSIGHLNRVQPLYALFVQDNLRITNKLTANLGFRWNPEPHPSEGNNQWSTFVSGQQSTAFPNAPLGIVSYGDAGVGSVIPSNWNYSVPRVGLAYQVTPKTVVRSGYGIFFDELMGLNLNSMVTSLPWIDVTSLVGPLQFSNPYGSGPVLDPLSFTPDKNVKFSAFSNYSLPTHRLEPGNTQSWNLVVERQLSNSLLLRAGYVGSKGTHLAGFRNVNPGIYRPGATAANINQRRVYNNIGALNLGISDTNSSYNSLQITANKQYGHGFSILGNYTYSRSIDEASSSAGGGNETGPDPFNLRINRGPSDFDVAHRVVVSGIWALPQLAGQRAVIRGILGGWQANGVFSAQTGNPLTVVSGVDTNFDGITGDFADYTYAGWQLPSGRSKAQKISEWFDTGQFKVGQTGTIGTGRRNQLRQPGFLNLDYSMFKDFPMPEGIQLQFRGEFFNVLNHANLGMPNATVNSPTFGAITTASNPRIIQLALKLLF